MSMFTERKIRSINWTVSDSSVPDFRYLQLSGTSSFAIPIRRRLSVSGQHKASN